MALRRTRDILDDEELVARAAAKLDIEDYGLFYAACCHWTGGAVDKRSVDREFMHFLLSRRAPSYVRHYCRRVIDGDPNLPPPPRFATPRGGDVLYILALITAATIFYLLFLV